MPPLKLEPCVDQTSLRTLEPLPALLHCLQRCVILSQTEANNTNDDGQDYLPVQQLLDSLLQKILECDLSDFELDKTTDFAPSREGLANREFARLLIGIYEVFIEYCALSKSQVSQTDETLLKLFRTQQKLEDAIRESLSSMNTKKNKAVPSSSSSSVSSSNTVPSKGKGGGVSRGTKGNLNFLFELEFFFLKLLNLFSFLFKSEC
jgi:hypothetical protein